MAAEIDRRNTVRVGGDTGASYTVVSAPVVLDILPSELARLPEERRAIVNLISSTVKENLRKWDEFTFELPQTRFANDSSGNREPLVSIADLCTQPDETSELDEITKDPETGERRRLTAEQCRDIAAYGRFSFPSVRSPRISHVWQLPSWLVHGRKNAAKDFKRRLGDALDHLVVRCPRRIYQKPGVWEDDLSLSIAGGVFRIGRHMKGIVGAFIGLPETVPRHDGYKYRMDAEKEFVRQRCASSELLDFSYYFDPLPALEETSARGRDELASAYDETYRLAALDTFQHVSPDDLSTSERISRIGDNWKQKWREEEVQRILQNERAGDDQKRAVLAERARAQYIIQDGDDKLLARAEREKLRLIEEAKRTHPILSLSQGWLSRWVSEQGEQQYEEWQREQEDENIAFMRSCDLHRAAKFEEDKLRFEREAWPEVRRAWLRDRVPARRYMHTYVLLNPREWREGGRSGFRRVPTGTGHVGWRLVLVWRDTVSFLRSGVYFTVVTNLWRGPVGLQALLSLDDVPYAWAVEFGVPRAERFHRSMITRIRAIWRRVRELRAGFEANTGVLEEDAVRWLHCIVNYGFRGCVSTALVVVGQPLLTGVNVVATAVVATTAVLWAPVAALAAYVISLLAYDWRAFPRLSVTHVHVGDSTFYIRSATTASATWCPLPGHLLGAVLGLLEGCLSGLGAVVHPAYAVLRGAVACVTRAARGAWDTVWGRILRRFGQWPSRDSFLARRVRGAGVAGAYYYRLSTELITRCLRAELESVELEEARRVIEDAVRRPGRELGRFAEDVLTGLCKRGEWASAVGVEEEARLRRVGATFTARERVLRRLTKMPRERRLRPERGVPVETVLEVCVGVVERFHEDRIERLGEVSTRLWRQAGAAAGDLRTLTRYLLEVLFSKEFLEEVDEETLEIPVTFEDVVNVYARPKRAVDPRRDVEYGDDGDSPYSDDEHF